MPKRRIATALVLAVLAGVTAVAPAAAGGGGSTSSTTTTAATPSTTGDTTTTTTAPTTPSTDPGSSSTTLPPDPEDPVAEQDAPEEEVPVSDVTVPPREPIVDDGAASQQQASRLIRREIRVARAEAVQAQEAYEIAVARVADQHQRLVSVEARLAALSREQRRSIIRLRLAEGRFEERVANAFIRGNAADVSLFFDSQDAGDFGLRRELSRSVLEADIDAVDTYVAAKAAVDADLRARIDELDVARRDLRRALDEMAQLRSRNSEAQFQLAVFAAGSEIVISGFVFPVGEPHSFGDSWGAPRMMGTEYEHFHQGTDILAPFGTPLYAVERGVITRVGTDVLGGLKLWVKGESGTYYYYAHLQAIAEGIAEGSLVEAGDTVGFVGDSGNAKGGAPHLHFQVHPDGGDPVNPYPLLRVVDDLRKLAEG